MIKPKIDWMNDCDSEMSVCQTSFDARARACTRKLNSWLRKKKVLLLLDCNCHLCVYDWRHSRRFHPRELFTKRWIPDSILSLCSLRWHNELLFPLKTTLPRVSPKILIEAGETLVRIKRHYERPSVRAYVRTRPDWIVNYPLANYSWRAFALWWGSVIIQPCVL